MRKSFSSSLPKIRGSVVRYGVAVLISLAAYAATHQFHLESTPYWTCYGAVVATALFCGFGPSLITMGLSIALVQGWGKESIGHVPAYKPTMFVMYSLMVSGLAMLRNRAENERIRSARKSEQAYARVAAVVESSNDAIISETLDGVITSWNRAAERLFGYSATEIVGREITLIIPESCRNEEQQLLERIRRGEEVHHYETVRLQKDGSPVHVSLTLSPIRDEQGMIIGASKISRDITDRKEAERLQRLLEARQNAFVDNLPVGVWFLDAKGHIFYGNATGKSIWEGAQYVGLENLDEYKGWWHGTDLELKSDDWAAARAIRKGETSLGEFIDIQCFDGTRKTILNSAVPVRDNDGSILGAVIINQDVTEQIQAQEKLRTAERRLTIAQNATNSGAWEWDIKAGTLWWSEGVWSLHGYEPYSFAASYDAFMQKLVVAEDRLRVQQAVETALQGHPYEVEYRTERPDGKLRYIVSRGTTILDAAGQPESMVGIAIDVTERKLSDEMLRRTEQLAAAGRLAASIAHEINNPLESLTNLIFLAKTSPANATSYLDTAEQELRRVAQIARQTLSFYKTSSPPEPVALPELLEGVLEVYGRKLSSRGIRIVKRYDAKDRVMLQSAEARQIFSNLIANAVEAMPNGGRLVLHVKLVTYAGHRRVTVIVADRGCGISEEQRLSVFQPFFTTKENGTGLGLWVAKGIVEKYGGTMRLRSSTVPGQSGTVFAVSFPVHVESDRRMRASGS